MRYKLFLVSALTACLLAGCSRSNESVNGFVQYNNEELATGSEIENEITQDNIVESMGEDTEQQSDIIQNEGSINSDILDQTSSSDEIVMQEHSESYEGPEAYVAGEDDSTTGDSLDANENSMVVPTRTPDELTETIPNEKPNSDQSTPDHEQGNDVAPTKVPNVTITPTKAPNVTITPTKMPSVTTTPTKVPSATTTPTKTPTKAPTPTPTKAPENAPSQTEGVSLSVRGVTISLGESKSSVTSKLGSPARTDETEFTYNFMVYNDNYKKFVMIAIQSDKVVGWYTDATDFSYESLTTSSKVSEINSVFSKSFSIKKTLSVTTDGVTSVFFMDMLGDNTIDGILVTKGASTDGVTSNVLTAWEKEILDLTNSFRARNGLNSLSWSTEAATAARLHSQDMADHNYFDHNGLDGSTPSTRMKAQGISFTMSGENIIGGYGNALYSSNGWMNSSGHRSNMLNGSYTYLGVGYVLGGSYGNYATQNFFRK